MAYYLIKTKNRKTITLVNNKIQSSHGNNNCSTLLSVWQWHLVYLQNVVSTVLSLQ